MEWSIPFIVSTFAKFTQMNAHFRQPTIYGYPGGAHATQDKIPTAGVSAMKLPSALFCVSCLLVSTSILRELNTVGQRVSAPCSAGKDDL